MSGEREILTWELFGVASRELAQMIADDGYEPDMVLSIARGGLLIGGAMGYALSVKNTYTMNVEFYTGVDERLEVPRILPPAPDFVDLHESKLLIVDDVADTGHTLKSVEEFCAGNVGEVRICSTKSASLAGAALPIFTRSGKFLRSTSMRPSSVIEKPRIEVP